MENGVFLQEAEGSNFKTSEKKSFKLRIESPRILE